MVVRVQMDVPKAGRIAIRSVQTGRPKKIVIMNDVWKGMVIRVRQSIGVSERIFGGIAAVFYLMGVVINTQARAKRPSVPNRSISAA